MAMRSPGARLERHAVEDPRRSARSAPRAARLSSIRTRAYVAVVCVAKAHVLERARGPARAARVAGSRSSITLGRDVEQRKTRRIAERLDLVGDVQLREPAHRAEHDEHVAEKARHHAGGHLAAQREPAAVADDDVVPACTRTSPDDATRCPRGSARRPARGGARRRRRTAILALLRRVRLDERLPGRAARRRCRRCGESCAVHALARAAHPRVHRREDDRVQREEQRRTRASASS